MSDNIEHLRVAANKANAALRRAEAAESDRDNQAIIGKTYRYRNCYSCPEKPSDYFWLYAKVVGVVDGRLRLFTFQTDKYNKTEIGWRENIYRINENYQPITAKEFGQAWKRLQDKIAETKP